MQLPDLLPQAGVAFDVFTEQRQGHIPGEKDVALAGWGQIARKMIQKMTVVGTASQASRDAQNIDRHERILREAAGVSQQDPRQRHCSPQTAHYALKLNLSI
jgi:hypothetical protein